MSVVAEEDVRARRQLAVADCEAMIDWYEKNKRIRQRPYYVSQTATVVLGALTPVLS